MRPTRIRDSVMNNKCNIFQYSPKELTTDAFLIWLFYYLDSASQFNELKQRFFRTLLLKDEDKNKTIENVQVSHQKGKGNGRTDLQVSFNFENESAIHTILFENKTWSETSKDQLNGYKTDFPDLYKYVFLKLGYVSIDDQQNAESCGYEVFNCFQLRDALKPIRNLHPILEQYFEYLDETFCKHIESFSDELFKKKNYDILGENHGEAQHYLMSLIYDKLKAHKDKYTIFIYQQGTSSGRPWTEIVFEDKSVFYDQDKTISEELFWRVDCRKGGYYLRINQYAWVMGDEPMKKIKEERLNMLRKIATDILKDFPKFTPGIPSNRWGANESEVVIFFLDDNDLAELVNQISDYTLAFMDKYNNLMR